MKLPLTFLLLLFLFPLACAPKAPPRVALPEKQAGSLLQEIKKYFEKSGHLQSAKGFAKLRLKLKGTTRRFEEVVVIQLPASFRFETVDDFGNTRFLIVSKGDHFFWRDFSNKESHLEELTEKKLRQFIPFASDLSETLGFFMGKIPAPDFSVLSVFQEKEAFLYSLVTPQKEWVWNAQLRQIVRFVSKDERGHLLFRYETDSPSHFWFKDFKTKNEIDIHYLDFEPNSVIAPSLFEDEK